MDSFLKNTYNKNNYMCRTCGNTASDFPSHKTLAQLRSESRAVQFLPS